MNSSPKIMSYTQARSDDPVALPGMPSHKYIDPEVGDGSQSARGLTSKSNKSVASNFTMKEAQDIVWKDVNFNVKGKDILKDCWGHVPSGSVCAIMGPSGAGKSSILNVLAGRSASAAGITITGNVSVGGRKINPIAFREHIAYVMQDDSLLATATPREALEFSAQLRLPSSTSRDQIKQIVEHLIVDLGLESCADVMIGGALIKGISGGQRKRTSVGVELVTDPNLVFLDEPTSGLDSYSAYNMVALLKKVAAANAAVLCTIHQPSSEVFELFDMAIFMKDGMIFYHGTVSDITRYFSSFDYHCPANYNPSDFVMHLAQSEPLDVLTEKGLFNHKHRSASLVGASSDDKVDSYTAEFVPKMKSSIFKELYWLSGRELVNIYRDTTALGARFGITIFLNLIFGLIFLNAGGKDDSDPDNFNAHFGAITMIFISSMFGPAQSVMLAFPFERPMFMREYATGTYRASSYFLSKAVLELPLTFIQTVVQYILVYFMVTMQGNFIFIVLIAWGLGAASCSVAVLLGCLVSDVKDVTELAPLLFVPQLLFAGFFIRTSLIPVFLRWAQYLCALKYAMNLVLLTEFNPDNKSCSGNAAPFCKNVISVNDIDKDMTYAYILILAALFVGFRMLGGFILVQKAKRFY